MKDTVPDPIQLIELADTIDPKYSAMIWLGAVLGLRWREVAGLRVGNVHALRKTVTIAEQVTEADVGWVTSVDQSQPPPGGLSASRLSPPTS